MCLSARSSIYYQGYDVSCCVPDHFPYDKDQLRHLWNECRLAHDRGPHEVCSDLRPGDIVTCLYIFGETLLVQRHPYGECLHLLKKEYK